MERKINFSIDEFYHLYGRGVDKRIIFIDDYTSKNWIGVKKAVLEVLPEKEIEEHLGQVYRVA